MAVMQQSNGRKPKQKEAFKPLKIEKKEFNVAFNTRGPLAEIYSRGMEYSLLEEVQDYGYKGINTPVRCKDFFQDAIWSEKLNKAMSIYGFSWKPEGKLLNQEFLFMGVRDEGKTIGDRAENCQSLLNKLEEILNYPLSSCKSDVTQKYIVTKFSIKWIEVPYLFSLFTLLLRSGLAFENESLKEFFEKSGSNQKITPNDKGYLNSGMSKIKALLEGIVYPQKYEDYDNTSSIHNRSGICNFQPK